jgi:hypothetical protein
LIGIGLTARQIEEEYLKLEMQILYGPALIDEAWLDEYIQGIVGKYTGNPETMMFSVPTDCKL